MGKRKPSRCVHAVTARDCVMRVASSLESLVHKFGPGIVVACARARPSRANQGFSSDNEVADTLTCASSSACVDKIMPFCRLRTCVAQMHSCGTQTTGEVVSPAELEVPADAPGAA